MNDTDWRGRERVDLGTQVVDRQIISPTAEPVGKVDDVELTRRPDGTLEVTALLVGTTALYERVPPPVRGLFRLGMRLGGGPDPERRIGLEHVVKVTFEVEVTEQAAEEARSPAEQRFRKFVSHLPGADHAGG